jgi:hypothetical protein
MVFTWQAVPASPWGVRVAVTVVVMPDGADVTRIGFEEEFRHREDPRSLGSTNGTRCGRACFGHRALPFETRFAVETGVVILWHGHLTKYWLLRSTSRGLLVGTLHRRLASRSAAGSADAEESEVIDVGRKPVLFTDTVTQRLHQRIVENEHMTAVAADQMVMPAVVEEFEVTNAAAEIGLGDQTEIAEQLQRSIYRRAVDGWGKGTDTVEDRVGREVLAGLSKRAQDH